MSSTKRNVDSCGNCYHYMAPEDFPEDQDIRAMDICTAIKEHTTCTGLPHIHFSRGIIKKTWWFLITLAAIAGLVYNLFSLGSDYAAYNVNVIIRVKTENQLAFPSITVCNMCPIKRSKLLEYLYNISETDGSFNFHKILKRKKRAAAGNSNANSNSVAVKNGNNGCCCSCSFNVNNNQNNVSNCKCQPDQYPYDQNKCAALTTAPTTTTVTTTTTTAITTTTTVDANVFSTSPDNTISVEAFTTTPTTTTPTTTKTLIDRALEEKDLLEILASLNDTMKKHLGFQFEELVLDCMFEGFDCTTDGSFESFFNEVHGNCYTFNSGWKDPENPKMALKTGRRHGLQMVLNVNQPEYVTRGNDMAGIRLVVHQQRSMPFPEDEGLALNPGQVTSLGLRQVNLEREHPPYNDCYDTKTPNLVNNVYEELVPGVIYTTTACMRTCYQRSVISQCGCGDPAYPLTGMALSTDSSIVTDYPPCSSKNDIQYQCKQNVSDMYNNELIECDCPEPCNESSYSVSLSLGMWPSEVQKPTLFELLQEKVEYSVEDTYQENLAKVELYYEDFNYELIKEIPGYELFQFISDCGGVLGLWLGMSVLTICEFLEFGLDMFLYGSIEGLRRKKRATRVEDINIQPEISSHETWNMENMQEQPPAETTKKRKSVIESPFYIK